MSLMSNSFSLTIVTYNSSGQLYCVLCNGPVKNELLWNAHVQGKKHKEVRTVILLYFLVLHSTCIMYI